MSWTPPEQLEHLVDLAITGRREAMVLRQRRERQVLDAQLAARGVLQSGMRLTGHYQIDTEAFDECAQGVIDDVLRLFTEVYGSMPVEAASWARQKLEPWFDGLAASIASVAQEMRVRNKVGGTAELPTVPLMKAKRRLATELGKIELRAQLRTLTPPQRSGQPFAGRADVFISHATEDKDAAARPLASALTELGYRVWLDETELKIGDRLLDRIDEGLASCRFGVVILSPSFFGKQWTRRELAGLVARQDAEERKIILPVWLNVDQVVIAQHLPSLAGVLAAKMSDGLARVIEEVISAIGPPAKPLAE